MGNKRSRLNQNDNTQQLILKDWEIDNAQQLILQDLETKTLALLSKTNNDPETEQDFRRTCALFENQKSNQQLEKAYQNYVSAYSTISSLPILYWDLFYGATFKVFDTEKESYKMGNVEFPKLSHLWCTAVLPNGELICVGEAKQSVITFIVNSDFKTQVLCEGKPKFCNDSAVYFNRSVYFFGGNCSIGRALSIKYNLDTNRWVNLSPVLESFPCNNIILFKRSILISAIHRTYLMLYSIDIDSFSGIYYNFGMGHKLMINAGRLYLIECKRCGEIYESEADDIFSWKRVGWLTESRDCRFFGLYNKGSIYIIPGDRYEVYYKFDLSKKEIFEVKAEKVRDYLIIK